MNTPPSRSLSSLKNDRKTFFHFIWSLPSSLFFRYLWKRNKRLLFQLFLVNYILPFILEMLPVWWTSRRKIGNRLRSVRIKINHLMVTNREFSSDLISEFFMLTIYHSVLESIFKFLKNKTSIESNLIIRRLLLHRLLYCEMEGMSRKNVAEDLEARLSTDISLTLSFFNYTLPSTIASIYALIREGWDLWGVRQKVDPLALLHPLGVSILRYILNWIKFWFENRKSRAATPVITNADNNEVVLSHKTKTGNLEFFVNNMMDGLREIQIQNAQIQQLNLLDRMIDVEVENSNDVNSLWTNMWNHIHSRSLFELMFESWIVHKVLRRRNINYARYEILQQDIERVVKLSRKISRSWEATKRVLVNQKRVFELLDFPTWYEEEKSEKYIHDLGQFIELRIVSLKFMYKEDRETQRKERKEQKERREREREREDREKRISGEGRGFTSEEKWREKERQQKEKEKQRQREREEREKVRRTRPKPLTLDITTEISFRPGMRYGIVGQNRSGKSTLCNILCKLLRPNYSECDIKWRTLKRKIDPTKETEKEKEKELDQTEKDQQKEKEQEPITEELDFNYLSRSALRDQVSYVPQKPHFFPGTIQENILIGNPLASEEVLLEAAEMAGLFEFISLSFSSFSASLASSIHSSSSTPALHPSGSSLYSSTQRHLTSSATGKKSKKEAMDAEREKDGTKERKGEKRIGERVETLEEERKERELEKSKAKERWEKTEEGKAR